MWILGEGCPVSPFYYKKQKIKFEKQVYNGFLDYRLVLSLFMHIFAIQFKMKQQQILNLGKKLYVYKLMDEQIYKCNKNINFYW